MALASVPWGPAPEAGMALVRLPGSQHRRLKLMSVCCGNMAAVTQGGRWARQALEVLGPLLFCLLLRVFYIGVCECVRMCAASG